MDAQRLEGAVMMQNDARFWAVALVCAGAPVQPAAEHSLASTFTLLF